MDILLGHLIGDYLLQNNWMANNKSKHKGLGWFTCVVHCILYTLAVCVTTWTFTIEWVIWVFCTHFFIDKFALAEKYLKYIKGRSIQKFLVDEESQEYSPHTSLRGSVVLFVYIAVDNTLHLILMVYGWRYLYG